MVVWNPNIEPVTGAAHQNYLREAYSYASIYSEDTVTHSGAVIVNSTLDEIIACGANHFPVGTNPSKKQIADRNWKYENVIHAEVAAIFSAAKNGKSTKDAVIYMPWLSCTPCAKAIIDSGIKTLIGHKEMVLRTPQRWFDSIEYALKLFEKCGVKTFIYDGPIGGVKSLFDGIEWEP